MFPLNDLNVVFCAVATVSAAVGYRVGRARRRSINILRPSFRFLHRHRKDSVSSTRSDSSAPLDSEGTESSSDCGTPLPDNSYEQSELNSLKRKRSATPEAPHDPSLDVVTDCSHARKKRRDSEGEEEISAPVADVLTVNKSVHVESCDRASPISTRPEGPEDTAVPEVVASLEAGTPESVPRTASGSPETRALSPIPPPVFSQCITSSTLFTASPPIQAVKPSSAFQAFSGANNPFGCSFAQSRVARNFASDDIPATASQDEQISPNATQTDPLAAAEYTTSSQSLVTGEENEEVISELKGAKLYIKRGERDFCEAIIGNVKLLRHKATGGQRLLFRREPVWKVSMNVRMGPAVRCSFDEAQSALRVTLKEAVEASPQEHVVVYALKRGKAARADYVEFAQKAADAHPCT